MNEFNFKYNLQLNDYPLLKCRELYPIENVVLVTVSAIPITDDFSEYLENNISEMCKHFNKDIILKVTVPQSLRNTKDDDYNISIYNFGEDISPDYDDMDFYDEDDCHCHDDTFDMDEDYDDDDDEMYNGPVVFGNDIVNETFDENGLYFNFTKILPMADMNGNIVYHFNDTMEEYDQASLFDEEISSELNQYIDSVEGNDWMFVFSFRHPISYYNDIHKSQMLSDETIAMSDKVIFSLMDSVSDGIRNIVKSDTMKLIIKAMINTTTAHGRIPFVGTVRFQILPERFSSQIQYNYLLWVTELYNMILEDVVEFESKITPPINIKADDMYFKPTDFLGQYYFPHGIEKRKEEEDGSKEEGNRNKEDNTKEKGNTKGNVKKSVSKKGSASSRRKGSRRTKEGTTRDDNGQGSQ